MSTLLRAHVIVLVTTGRLGQAVASYAQTLTEVTSQQVVLVDGRLLARYRSDGPAVLLQYFHSAAVGTLQTKRAQVDVPTEFES